jgi:glutathione S-transferase
MHPDVSRPCEPTERGFPSTEGERSFAVGGSAMSITYYYSPMSTAARTTWAIEELAVPCERILVDLQKKETRTPAFLAMNPNGRIPLLVIDGTPIFESTAILIYLAETYGVDKGLYPKPGLARAEQLTWIVWANIGMLAPLQRWMQNTSGQVPAEQHNAKAAEVAKREADAMLKVLDDALAGKSYLTGDAFTMADLAAASYTGLMAYLKYDFSANTNVVAWAARCQARPAFQKAMKG